MSKKYKSYIMNSKSLGIQRNKHNSSTFKYLYLRDKFEISKMLLKVLSASPYFFAIRFFIFRLKDVIDSCIKNELKFLIIAKNPTLTDFVIWVPSMCLIYDVPFVMVNNKTMLTGINCGRKSIVVGLKTFYDLKSRILFKLTEIIKYLNKKLFIDSFIIFY